MRFTSFMFSRKNTGDGTTEPGACDGAVQAIDAKDKVISEQRFDSIWDAIEATPAKAANMKARAELMMAIQASVTGWKLT